MQGVMALPWFSAVADYHGVFLFKTGSILFHSFHFFQLHSYYFARYG
jgi:hypothetical protein